MEYLICIIIMLVWAMVFYCWGYWNGSRDAYKRIFRKWVKLKMTEENEGERNDV